MVMFGCLSLDLKREGDLQSVNVIVSGESILILSEQVHLFALALFQPGHAS